jgi:hypothetical protein
MSMVTEIANLLCSTEKIRKQYEERDCQEGNRFNIFSILKMERKENETHSAFLAELLNPKGSHLKGDVFLKLFLEQIGNNTIDPQTATVSTEVAIGKVTAEDGGRIDIYINDIYGNILSIENKIYASDQKAQIKRYCNHEKDKNTVYYLTLDGKEPDPSSYQELKIEEDFYLLSYSDDILKWLDKCVVEVENTPSIKEGIKQYIHLLKKLTKTMNEKEQGELTELMLKHYKESAYISANFDKVLLTLKDKVRNAVGAKLVDLLKDEYIITFGNPIKSYYAQIWISPKETAGNPLHFGVESFNGRGNFEGNLFIGTFYRAASSANKSPYSQQPDVVLYSNWWMNVIKFQPFRGYAANLSDPVTLQELALNPTFFEEFTNYIVEESYKYLQTQTKPLVSFIKREELAKINQQ